MYNLLEREKIKKKQKGWPFIIKQCAPETAAYRRGYKYSPFSAEKVTKKKKFFYHLKKKTGLLFSPSRTWSHPRRLHSSSNHLLGPYPLHKIFWASSEKFNPTYLHSRSIYTSHLTSSGQLFLFIDRFEIGVKPAPSYLQVREFQILIWSDGIGASGRPEARTDWLARSSQTQTLQYSHGTQNISRLVYCS